MTTLFSRSHCAAGAVLLAIVGLRPTAVARAACRGDCGHDGLVTVDELLIGVNIALGIEDANVCPPMDANHDGAVTIDELLAAVNAALNGCPANQAPQVPCADVYRTYPSSDVELPIEATDPDGDTLRYTSMNLPDGASLDADTGILSWTPTADQIGPFYVPVSVTDDGGPPQTADGFLVFQVAPVDPCTQATCEPASGCTSALVPLSRPCCIELPTHVAEPVVGCPQGRVLFLGRNTNSGFGRLQDCDRLQVVNSGQVSAIVRFNLEAGCINADQLVMLHARMETTSRLLFDADTSAFLDPGVDGYAQKLGLSFPIQTPGPFFDLDGTDAELTVTLTDADGVSVSTQLRLTLTFQPLPDFSDLDAPTPPSVCSVEAATPNPLPTPTLGTASR